MRALAVLPVVFYHAGIPGFSGGFVGVDMFFVISGYLITRIIHQEVLNGRFSIWRFYERRVRRIIPALAVVVIGVMAFGALFILPESLDRMASSGLAAMFFFANIHFWLQAENYFAPGADTDPFLHTWSLAVEEQFYIVFPLVFILVSLGGRRPLSVLLVAAGLVSFVLMLAAQSIAPSANFFFPVTRAWELLVGSLIAMNMVPKPASRKLAAAGVVAGLLLIVCSVSLIDSTMRFPGWVTLAPVLGAALIIQFGDAETRPKQLLLEIAPIRWIGLISYSLYLWHWPVFVLGEHFLLHRPPLLPETAVMIALSFGLAFLSYHFVEKPFRHARAFRQSRRMLAALLPLALVAVALLAVTEQTQGFAMRHQGFVELQALRDSQRATERRQIAATLQKCFLDQVSGRRVFACDLTGPEESTAMIWGDSFAHHYLAPLSEQPDKIGGLEIISFVMLQCPPVLDYDPVNLPACKDANDRALETLQTRGVDTVFLAANWFSYILVNRISHQDIAATVSRLQDMDIRVVLVGQSPIFDYSSPEEALFRVRQTIGSDAYGKALNRVPAVFNLRLRAEAEADLFFDPTEQLCTEDWCTFYDEHGFVFWDYGHLSISGARRVVAPLLQAARDQL